MQTSRKMNFFNLEISSEKVSIIKFFMSFLMFKEQPLSETLLNYCFPFKVAHNDPYKIPLIHPFLHIFSNRYASRIFLFLILIFFLKNKPLLHCITDFETIFVDSASSAMTK